jgi:hypothetical protein
MRKKLLIVAAALVLVPLMAWAGMTAISDVELEEVDGQTGISISMSMTMSANQFAWEDNDGFGATLSTGAVILSNVTLPAISLDGVDINAGTSGGSSYLSIDTGATDLISGDMTIGAVVIGSSWNATTPSLGKFVISGIGIKYGEILISAIP